MAASAACRRYAVIEQFNRVAKFIQPLRLPLLTIAAACCIAIVVILLSSSSDQTERLLIPCTVGLLWALSGFTLIETFGTVPDKASSELKFFTRQKQRLRRLWYWIMSALFVCATLGALFITNRLLMVWLSEYA